MVDNRNIRRINKLLKQQLVQKFGVLGLALLVIATVAVLGTQQNRGSHAATGAVLSVSPASASWMQGSQVSVAIVEDSGTDPVNSVQASLSYDDTKLQFVSIREGTAFPNVAATSTGTAGVVRIGRGTATGTSVSGSNTVVWINFNVLGSTGTTGLSFDPAFSFVVRSTDNVNILATTNGGTYNLQLPAPVVSSVSPQSGPAAGGTSVTIAGSNFVSGASVSFGGLAATNLQYANVTVCPTGGVCTTSLQITATAPAHAAGVVDVKVTNPDGQSSTKIGAYNYIAPAPSISGISPTSGPTAGGTAVTITGANFVSGATVKFDTAAATNVIFNSATSLTVTTPAHAAGTSEVIVTNPDGQVYNSSLAGVRFTYIAPAPSISGISPTSGPTAGGTAVTITGANFVSGATVTFGSSLAGSVTFNSSTSLTAISPAHAAGLVAMTVTNPDGQSGSLTTGYTYRAPAPAVTAVSPNVGTVSGGTTVTISGSNFVSGASVSFGSTAAISVTFLSSTSLSAVVPAHASGVSTVTVLNPDQQSGSLVNGYTYLALGDANNDGRVNAIDLSILISYDGQNYPAADFNGDGTVGSADMAILLGHWTW